MYVYIYTDAPSGTSCGGFHQREASEGVDAWARLGGGRTPRVGVSSTVFGVDTWRLRLDMYAERMAAQPCLRFRVQDSRFGIW